MALDRELRRLLEYALLPEPEAASAKDAQPRRASAREILARLVRIHRQTCVPSSGAGASADMNLPELLVLTAEAAIAQADFATASESVEWFFSECQLKNQFYCRAQFVRAHCGSHDAQAETGAARLKQVLNAIHFVLSVLPVATDARKRPVYDFLVYNASVTYWQIARQLMKPSSFQFLVPSLTKILEAVKLIGESDISWTVRLQLALTYAQLDAGQLASAAKTINDAVDVQLSPRLADPAKASDERFKKLYEEALGVQVHVGSLKDPECQKIVPNVKRMIPPTNKRASLLVKLQCVKSGNVAGSLESAYAEIIQEATGFQAFSADTTTEEEVTAFVDSLKLRALDTIDAEVMVETAIHATFNQAFRVAVACDVVLQSKGKNMPPRIRVLYQVLKAVLLVAIPPAHSGGKLSARQRQTQLLVRRVESVKAFERALLASKRQQDASLVERVCIYAWNLSLPLLQPHLRIHLERIFSLSASVLEELESLLLGLRARLHLEVAKLEVVSDFLAKANVNVSKALALDYGTIVRPSNEGSAPMSVSLLSDHPDWIARPVDTHLLPIKKKMNLKLAAEGALSEANQVLSMLEQVKEGKDARQQQSILTRCVEVLEEMECSATSPDAADHLRLWSEVAALAWSVLHDGNMAQQVAESALETYFSTSEAGELVASKTISSEKSLMVLEVDLRLLLVEVLAAKLKHQSLQADGARYQVEMSANREDFRQGERKQPRQKTKEETDLAALVLLGKEVYILGMHRPVASDENTSTSAEVQESEGTDAEDENTIIATRREALDVEIQARKTEILEHLSMALKAATRIGWPFILENTCIYLWNYHFHIFRMVLEAIHTPADTTSEAFDPQLVLPECLAAFEVVYATLETAPSTVDGDLLANIALGLSSMYEKTARLDKALAIADTFLKRKPLVKAGGGAIPGLSAGGSGVNTLHLKRFAELKARVQLAQNAKEIVPTENSTAQIKVVTFLEAMEVTFKQLSVSGAQPGSITEKAQSFYQKVVAMWQASAGDILTGLTSSGLERTLEEAQQQLELYVELWVRVGCGAFRLRNVKYAVECAEQALLVLSRGGDGKKSKPSIQMLLVGSTWKWFALAELLYGRAILALGHGDSLAPKLVLAALTHLVRAVDYGFRGNNPLLAIKACEVMWNAAIAAVSSDAEAEADSPEADGFLERVVEHLRKSLRYLDQVTTSSEAHTAFYGEMILLTLAMCEKADKWDEAFEVCESVLKSFGPASHRAPLPSRAMKEIQTMYAIAGANLGKPSSAPKSGGNAGSQDQDPLLQAQILKKVAFSSSKDPPAQLKALSNAYTELDGQTEEQALILLDMAEWLFTNQFPTKDVGTYLDCAISTLLNCGRQDRATSPVAASRATSSQQQTGSSASAKHKQDVMYSPLWFAEKLLRAFVMRAELAVNCNERLKYLRLAVYEVEHVWRSILGIVNEIELQSVFAQDPAASELDFDEWKKDKLGRYAVPVSERDWIGFFVEHEESISKRFFMPWAEALQSVQTPSVRHITQPVLTGAYLESLLRMLPLHGLENASMVSTIGLYQVLFRAYVPQHTYTAQVWLDLTQFEVLERLNISRFPVALQTALDTIQNHGDALIKELQDVDEPSDDPTERAVLGRRRKVLQVSHLGTREKAVASIHLLLSFGFVRQAKVLLEILKHSLDYNDDAGGDGNEDNNAPTSEAVCECLVLSSHIFELEGQEESSLARMESALQCPRLELTRYLKWTLRKCQLDSDISQGLQSLQEAEKEAARVTVGAMYRLMGQRPGTSSKSVSFALPSSIGSSPATAQSPPDLDIVLLLAQVVFRRAKLLLKKAGSAAGSAVAVHLHESKQALDDCLKMLHLLGANYECSRVLLRYSHALLAFSKSHGENHLAAVALDGQAMLEEALVLLESHCSRLFLFHTTSATESEKLQQENLISPLGLTISLSKLQLAKLFIATEVSSAIIQEEEMTWYRYYEDSQRNVVEKWLSTTGSALQKSREWDLPRAMVLISSAVEMLGNIGGLEVHRALAQVLALQCQRLELVHGDDKQKAGAVRSRLWTRFTSSETPHATWICCNGTQSDASMSASPSTASIESMASQNDPQVLGEERSEKELQDEQEVDAFLVNCITSLQNCQRVGLEKRSIELLRRSSYELVQVLGCQQPFECAKSLLMHQSTQVREEAAQLFNKCVSHTNVQRLHLQRMKKLRKTHTNAPATSLPFQLSQLYLDSQSEAVKRMTVDATMDTVLALLPAPIRVLCLHFSPERCFLYAAFMSSTDKHTAVARMEFTDTQTRLLDQLNRRTRAWRDACAKELQSYEDAHVDDESFEMTLVDVEPGGNSSDESDALEKTFIGIVADTMELLGPLLAHSAMQTALKSGLPGSTLVLLVDRTLSSLPLEALPALEPADAIARDFSIHMLYQRLVATKTQPPKSNEMRVIVDPRGEDPGDASGQTMASVVKQVAGTWKEAVEHGQVPSVTDWQHSLIARRGGGLLYVGPNRVLGSCLPLTRLVGMNVALTCQALLLLDLAENASSARRQSKTDSEKAAWERELEADAHARALLLSLCGVNVLAMNQWTTTFHGNRRLALGLLQGLAKGFSVGKALKKFGESVVASPVTAAADAGNSGQGGKQQLKSRVRYNPVVYGLAHLTLKIGE